MKIEDIRAVLLAQSFDNFATDSSNQEAYDACKSICNRDALGKSLIICGGENCGKTHLLRAVLSEFEKKIEIKTKYTLGEDFGGKIIFNRVRDKEHGVNNLLSKYMENDIIIIDDIDFLVGKSFCEHAFIEFIKMALSKGIRLVFSMEKRGLLSSVLDPELYDQLSAMKIVDIHTQSIELRKKWMGNILATQLIDFPMDLADEIVTCAGTIRECKNAMFYYNACVEQAKISLWDEFMKRLKKSE